MKFLHCIIILIFSTITSLYSNEIQTLRSLIDDIKDKTSMDFRFFPDQPFLSHSRLPEFKSGVALIDLFKTSEESIFNQWDSLATDPHSELILITLTTHGNTESFLKAGEILLQRYKEKKIDHSFFTQGYLLREGRFQHLFTYNYNNPRVIDFLNRVSHELQSRGESISYIEHILSKKRLISNYINYKTSKFPVQPDVIEYFHDTVVDSKRPFIFPFVPYTLSGAKALLSVPKIQKIVAGALFATIAIFWLAFRAYKKCKRISQAREDS